MIYLLQLVRIGAATVDFEIEMRPTIWRLTRQHHRGRSDAHRLGEAIGIGVRWVCVI
jgi:hypothetical protein